MSDGKKFEKLVGQSIEKYGWARSSNHLHPLADHTQFLRPYGRGCVWEAKDCRQESFSLDNITDNERKVLTGASESGAVAIVLIQHWYHPIQWRVWGCHWCDWLMMEAEIGFVPEPLYDLKTAKKPRRKSGTASIRFEDGRRPRQLEEVLSMPSGRLDLNPILSKIGGVLV